MTGLRTRLRGFSGEESGQALLETAFFAPFVVFGILAVLFFSHLGVLAERSESAVRYGNDVSYKNNNQLYSVASVYALINEVQQPGSNSLAGLCVQPAGVEPSPAAGATLSPIQQDIKDALTDAQHIGPYSGPSAKPFWRPDTVSVPGCQPNMIRLSPANSTGGTTGQSANSTANGGTPVSTVGLSVSSTIVPPMGLNILNPNPPPPNTPSTTNAETSAHMTFLNVAAPNTLIACIPGFSVAATALAPTLTQSQQQALQSYCPSQLQ